MPVALYFDVHVPEAIATQLRRRDVDVLNARDDGRSKASDEELLGRAKSLGRVLFTQDIRFKARAETWQRESKPFAGLLFAHPLQATIGQLAWDLELIARASEPDEWRNVVAHLPL